MTELSPLTKAVVEAAGDSEPGIYATIIATLTSLAGLPCAVPACYRGDDYWVCLEGINACRDLALSIARELEDKANG